MFCCLTALVVVDHDSGTLAKECLGNAAAEPTTAAGHHDHLLGDHGTRGVGISRTGCGWHPNTPLLVTKEHEGTMNASRTYWAAHERDIGDYPVWIPASAALARHLPAVSRRDDNPHCWSINTHQ
jgi:hypothetical protein